jgi:pilus assembly protein CpaE
MTRTRTRDVPAAAAGQGEATGSTASPAHSARRVGEHLGVRVVDPDKTVRDVLAEQLKAIGTDVTGFVTIKALLASAEESSLNVVVFGPSEAPDKVVQDVRSLAASRPGAGVVMVVYELATEVLQRALRAGVDDVVTVSADEAELLEAVNRAAGKAQGRHPMHSELSNSNGRRRLGQLITVYSSKGGAGKTVTASNVAAALARRSDGPVVLVDADLQFGDLALIFQLQPVHTIEDAVQAGDRLDGALLWSLLLRHEDSNLYVLAAPTEPGSADLITKADLSRVLALLREQAAYVVVDTPASFGEITLGALEEADDILVVAGLDVLSLKGVRVGLQTMRILGVPFSRIKFVLNRANAKVGLTPSDAARAVELQVDAALPSDVLVPRSVNRGEPAVLSAPRSQFARAIDDLVGALVQVSTGR